MEKKKKNQEKQILPGPLSMSNTLPCFKTLAGLKGPSNSFSSLVTDLTAKNAVNKYNSITLNGNVYFVNQNLPGTTVGTIFPLE